MQGGGRRPRGQVRRRHPEAAPGAVELPDHQQVEAPRPGVGEHPVGAWPGDLDAAHALVDVLARHHEAPLGRDLPELIELEADVLAMPGGADAGVEGSADGAG